MASVFVTGSSEGLGLLAARRLVDQGHSVVLHARNSQRAGTAQHELPAARDVVVGDVSSLAAIRRLAEDADAAGPFDAVIHNVGIGYRELRRNVTVDGLSQLWVVNVLAPYMLTSLMRRPGRLIYLSSGMHAGASTQLRDLQWANRRWDGVQAYSDSKFHDILLTFAVARRWSGTAVNAVSPGWVPTRMGGPGAPDDIDLASDTQAWLAVSDDRAARETSRYLYHRQPGSDLLPATRDTALQDELIAACQRASGVQIAAS